MEIKVKVPVMANAKTLKMSAKCSDCFAATLHDGDGSVIKEYDGYVPEFMPVQHYGDYVMLDIDIETGQITNWTQPTREQIEAFVNGDAA